MQKYAILIDAGFLKRKLGSQKEPADADKIISFVNTVCTNKSLEGKRLHRVYYYDAPPLEETVERPLSGGRLNLGRTDLAKMNKSILDRLKRAPFFALRLGELKFRGWRVSPRSLPKAEENVCLVASDLSPNIQQKGVDMRIGLDMASLTLKKQVDVIVLVTGDSDFIPAMKFARKEGVQMFLITLGHGVQLALHEHSDLLLKDITI